MPEWKTIGSKTVFEHARLTLIEDTVILPSGEQITYLRHGLHRDYPTIISRGQDGRFLMLNEHAYPINKSLLQFPEGDTKQNETLEAAAARELQEEAGLRAGRLTILGYSLREHRRSTTKNFVLLAEDLTDVQDGGGDKEETGIESLWLTESEIWNRVAKGEIIQKNTLAARVIFQAYKQKNVRRLN